MCKKVIVFFACSHIFLIFVHDIIIEIREVKVLFDHQIFCFRYGGASKYFAMLMNAMPREEWESTALMPTNEYAREKKLFPTYRYRFKGQGLLADYLNRPYTNNKLSKGNYDVFHQTNFGTYCLKSLGDKPMVTTYHDSNLSTIDPHPKIVAQQKASLERADAIICVSNNTKKDMLQLFDVDERKVHVVYHGIELPNMASLVPDRLFNFPYLLFVGRRSEYKNFTRFIQAFSMISASYPELHVICTSQAFSKEENSLFSSLGIQTKVHTVNATEQDMKRLYRDAIMLVFPSLYEGFGMPILEAWSCGCPVALSDASCFPEIAGDAGCYFNPVDVEDMARCMMKVVDDCELRCQLIDKGTQRVANFSWEATAKAHLNIYKELL